MPQVLLKIQNLKTVFRVEGELVKAVDGISFSLPAGSTLAIVGESGSGKSVCSLSIMQLISSPPGRIESGTILFQGKDLLQLNDNQMRGLRGKRISMIFQDPMNSLNPVFTCGSQVAESVRIHLGKNRKQAFRTAAELFKDVGIPSPEKALFSYPHQMSGGMRQRVMIAMALACRPKLLIADEPTTALDVTVQAQILDLLRALREKYNMAILFITHDLGLVSEFADHVVVMHNGKIVEQGTAETIFSTPSHEYTKMLLQYSRSIIGDASVNMESPAESGRKRLLKVDNIRTWFPVRKGVLKKTVGHIKAVDDVSLEIYKGEVLGLVGESGCGKTTLGRTLLHLETPSNGRLFYHTLGDYTDIARRDMLSFHRQAQIIFQDPYSSLNPRMTIGAIIREPLRIHKLCNKQEAKAKALAMLEKVGLQPEHYQRYPHEFSGGQRQRIAIARTLIVNPEFIVADEPVSSLDVSIQAQILDLMLQLKQELNLTYLFVSHDLSVIEKISDRIAVMFLGRIVEMGPKQTVFSNPKHPYTRALLSAIPRIDKDNKQQRIMLEGDIPHPSNPPSGCHFHPRCPHVMEKCRKQFPDQIHHEGRDVACWLYHH